MQLAVSGDTSAATAIKEQLVRESRVLPEFSLASALEVLGDRQGPTTLAELCANSSLPVDLRMSAAKYLLDHKRQQVLSICRKNAQSFSSSKRVTINF